jgi:hypothetical protein
VNCGIEYDIVTSTMGRSPKQKNGCPLTCEVCVAENRPVRRCLGRRLRILLMDFSKPMSSRRSASSSTSTSRCRVLNSLMRFSVSSRRPGKGGHGRREMRDDGGINEGAEKNEHAMKWPSENRQRRPVRRKCQSNVSTENCIHNKTWSGHDNIAAVCPIPIGVLLISGQRQRERKNTLLRYIFRYEFKIRQGAQIVGSEIASIIKD